MNAVGREKLPEIVQKFRKKNCKNFCYEKHKRIIIRDYCVYTLFAMRILCISKSHTIDKLQITHLTCVGVCVCASAKNGIKSI